MKLLSSIVAVVLVASVNAQTTLLVNPGAIPSSAGLTFGQPGANFYDITVLNPAGITLQALELSVQNPVGTTGTIEIWITNPGITTHVGREQIQGNWTKITEGDYTSGGLLGQQTLTCQEAFTVNVPDTELAAGSYGLAIVYLEVFTEFWGVTTYPGAPFANSDVSITNGTTQATAFASAPLNAFTFGNPPVNFAGSQSDFGLIYSPGSVAHACAEKDSFGAGCIKNSASAFQLFEDAGATSAAVIASAALQGRSITFVPNASFDGYIVTQTGAAFVAPSGNETTLTAVDDGEAMITLPNLQVPFVTDAGLGLTANVFIHSNGYVSMAPQSPLLFAPVDPDAVLDADATAFYSYHDFNPTEAGSGLVSWEEDLNAPAGPVLYVTYQNVESYPGGVANPSTVQFQFDLNPGTGLVHIVWQSIDPVGGSLFFGGDNTLIGFSPGGESPDTDAFDLATIIANPLTLQLPEAFPLQLDIVGDPLIGSSMGLLTSNGVGLSIGINLLSADVLPVPVPLAVLGGPVGCDTFLDPALSILNTFDNFNPPASMTLTLPIPNNPTLAGLEFASQSFFLDPNFITNPNLFTNILASNAVIFKVGNF